MCLRLCFRKRQMLDVHLLRVFSFCSKTIRRSLISLLRGERVFLYAVGGFLPVADAIFSPTRKIKDFSRGDPEAPCVDSARRTDGAKCAIPSHLVLLTNPPTSSTQPQGIMSNTPAKICGGVCVYAPPKFFRRGPRIAAAVLTRRKNADVRPALRFSALLRNYRVAL